jgi:hypothetical protein
MKTTTWLALLGAALVGMQQTQVEAQSFPIKTQLTLQHQDSSKLSKGVYTDKVRSVRLSSNYILNLLQPFYTSTLPSGFPLGSKLVLVNFDHFEVQSVNGVVLVSNTAPYLTYTDTYTQTNFLFQGKENINSGLLNHTYFYQATIQFQDPSPSGTSFTFTGNTVEKYSRSAQDTFGDHLASGSLTITGYGSGNIDGSFFLLSGKFSTPVMKWIE